MNADDLPTGPYSVRWGRVLLSTLGMTVLGVFLLAIGVGMLVYAVSWAADLWETETIWAANELEVGDERVAFSGEVETTNLVLNDYDLDVEWLDPSGEVRTIEVDMMTFFTGPDSETPMTVRAMADDLSRATTSWQHDAFWHGVVWVLAIVAMGVLLFVAGALIVVGAVADVRKTSALSKEGRLRVVPVTNVEASDNNGTVSVTLTVEVDGATHGLTYVQGSADPLYLGESQVVVLAGEGKVLLPRADGYPLDLR
jgi:hypothetical protein